MRSTSAKIALSLVLSLALGAAGVAHAKSEDTASEGDAAKGDKGKGEKDKGDKGDKGGKGKGKKGGAARPLVAPT